MPHGYHHSRILKNRAVNGLHRYLDNILVCHNQMLNTLPVIDKKIVWPLPLSRGQLTRFYQLF